MIKFYRVHFHQSSYTTGYIDIKEDEDWDGRPVGNEFDARDLAYDLVIDGSDRVHWSGVEDGDFNLLDVEEIDGV